MNQGYGSNKVDDATMKPLLANGKYFHIHRNSNAMVSDDGMEIQEETDAKLLPKGYNSSNGA